MAVPKRARIRDWLLETADRAARAAQKALLTKAPQRAVMTGASGSPTSALDRATEKVIEAALEDAPIPLNLCSEEVGTVDHGAEWTVVADPVDGTRNALHGIPFHAVCLAVGKRDLASVELGLVRSIPTNEVFWAERGKGAWHDDVRLRVPKARGMEPLVGVALDYDQGLDPPRVKGLHFRDLGSAALEMCYVASGGLDAFLCAQPLVRVVDIASSTLIVREAGGQVLDLERRDLNVPFDASKKFAMVAVGDPTLYRRLVG